MGCLLARATRNVEGAENVRKAELRVIDDTAREQEAIERSEGAGKRTRRRIEGDGRCDLVVILEGGKARFIVTAQIGQLQGISDVIFAFPGEQRLFCLILRVEGRFDRAQVCDHRVGEGVAIQQAGNDGKPAAERRHGVDAVIHLAQRRLAAAERGHELVSRADRKPCEGGFKGILLAKLLARAKAAVILFEMIEDEQGAEAVGRFNRYRGAHTPEFACIHIAARDGIGHIAIALEIGSGKAHGNPVADRNVDHALIFHAAIISEGDRGIAPPFLHHRLGGDGIEHAARRIAAIKGTLRTAQDLDPLHVEEFGFEQQVAGQGHVILVHADTGIAGCRHRVISDAAYLEIVAGEIALGEADIRDRFHEVGTTCELQLVQRILVEGRNRDRNILDRLFDLLGGHRHGAEAP